MGLFAVSHAPDAASPDVVHAPPHHSTARTTPRAPAPQHGYRADIDGMRALAICAVLAFHAFPSTLPGGFAGVDIFFVISGYLITRVLAREQAAGKLRLGHFYARRMRRIVPALALMLTGVKMRPTRLASSAGLTRMTMS